MGGAEIPACIFMPSVVLQALVCLNSKNKLLRKNSVTKRVQGEWYN